MSLDPGVLPGRQNAVAPRVSGWDIKLAALINRLNQVVQAGNAGTQVIWI